MRAYTLHDLPGIESIQAVTRPDPTPGPGQALVAVRAVSLNYRDLLVATGRYGGSRPLGIVLASDGAGEVIAVGPGVTSVKPGDRVVASFMPNWVAGPMTSERREGALGGAGADGMLAEQACLPADALVHIPDSISCEEAATLPCAGVTAWNALFVADEIKPGTTVLALGTGGVSIFALQLAKLAGARVIITSSSADKLARAKSLGADEGIDYAANPNWQDEVLKLTGGRGVDHVVEVGGPGTLNKSFGSVKIGGTVSMIGVLTGFGGEVDTGAVLFKNIRLQGIYVGSRDMLQALTDAVANNGMKPVIDRVFPFEEAQSAYRYLESGKHFGKIVIKI
jgi:NADPH:quinone reductase-like Zn-dependent oxidoreductase